MDYAIDDARREEEDAQREEERDRQMLTSALATHLEKSSRAEWNWRAAPRTHLHIPDQELFY